jgi:hypothetical protein
MNKKLITYDDILEKVLPLISDQDDPYHSIRIGIREYLDHPYPSGLYDIIFTHAFAKALWGGQWLKHLKRMVGYRIPLYYLQKFIEQKG